jgi:predicted enzyme related to lactoylglutathione lyase
MTSRPFSVVLDCADPEALARFWAPVLGYDESGRVGPYVILVATDADRPHLILQRVDEPKPGKNRMHIDLYATDVDAEAQRLEGLGARRGRDHAEDGFRWIVMADPEDNEFCVVWDRPPS